MDALSKKYSEGKTITIMLSFHILILLGLTLRNSTLVTLSLEACMF